jgi:hypothetical protein
MSSPCACDNILDAAGDSRFKYLLLLLPFLRPATVRWPHFPWQYRHLRLIAIILNLTVLLQYQVSRDCFRITSVMYIQVVIDVILDGMLMVNGDDIVAKVKSEDLPVKVDSEVILEGGMFPFR